MHKLLLTTAAIAAFAAGPMAWAQSNSEAHGGAAAANSLHRSGTVASSGDEDVSPTIGGRTGFAPETTGVDAAQAATTGTNTGMSSGMSTSANASSSTSWSGPATTSNSHSQACAARYHTYNPTTDMFYARPGVQQRCTLGR